MVIPAGILISSKLLHSKNITVGTDGTVYVEGTSQYTVTVETYSDTADLSGASGADSWENYAVEQPAELA